AGETLTDYQIRFEIDTETPIFLGLMEPDGSDLRVTMTSCCEPLCYYIESGINTPATVIWVKVPLIEAGAISEIYAFFGNPGVEAASDVDCTFDFYEGFDDADFNFDYLCGEIDDSTVTAGDFNLAWINSGMLGSNITFPFDEAYTAEVMMNSATGNWPGVFWAKSVSHKNYGLMPIEGEVRISLTGGGTSYCSGHNWASPLLPYSETEGLWSFTWIETGSLVADFPTVGEIVSSNAVYAKDQDLQLVIGGISFGTGSLNMDWVRVRKYAAIPPVLAVGDLLPFAPAGELDLPAELIGCGSAVIDAGEDYETYDWSSGGDAAIEEVDLSDTYYLTVIDAEGCIQFDSVEVIVAPTYELAESDIICTGMAYTFPDGVVMEDITEETIYTSVLTTDGFGCDSVIVTTVEVYELTPLLDLGGDISTCGDTVFLDAGAGFGSYDWSDGEIG
ncbi:DUF2341 domain-containing protein, partial [Crocinitomix sp.]|nr:DUF2341 domain-containing protein [Crocinitomix sp.]